MEGVQCCEKFCGVFDFLPFHCPHCDKDYCLEHRSRFKHSCVFVDSENSSSLKQTDNDVGGVSQSVSSIFAAVENRFEDLGEEHLGSAKLHLQVKSSHTPDLTDKDIAKNERLLRLDAVKDHLSSSSSSTTSSSFSSSSERDKRINSKTRNILLASHAKGNVSIDPVDRFHLLVHFPPPSTSMITHAAATTSSTSLMSTYECVFVSRHCTVGEALHYIGSSLSLQCFGSPVKDRSISLAFTTQDHSDWRGWDREARLTECLMPFDDIFVFPVPTAEVVQAQKAIEEERGLRRAVITTEPLHESSLPPASSPVPNPVPAPSTLPLDLSQQPVLVTEVVDLKETSGAGIDSVSGVFFVSVSFKGRVSSVYTDKSSTVDQLKAAVKKQLTLSGTSMKLIFKGKVLADPKATLEKVGISSGGKIMVMGGEP